MKEQSSITSIKGYIICPICGETEVVEEGASGKVSHRCACHRFIESDYDLMTAREIKPIRGALKNITKKIAM